MHVAARACLVCGALPANAHRVRFAQPKAFGRKISDEFTVPLCRSHHRELHHNAMSAPGDMTWGSIRYPWQRGFGMNHTLP
jgi:hypothetical protein